MKTFGQQVLTKSVEISTEAKKVVQKSGRFVRGVNRWGLFPIEVLDM